MASHVLVTLFPFLSLHYESTQAESTQVRSGDSPGDLEGRGKASRNLRSFLTRCVLTHTRTSHTTITLNEGSIPALSLLQLQQFLTWPPGGGLPF